MDDIEEPVEEQDVHIHHDSPVTSILHYHWDTVLAH
jgi:hypothetical protein